MKAFEDLPLSQGYKICPICGTPSHRNAAVCGTCGASLTNVPVGTEVRKLSKDSPDYDLRYGETDLLEGRLRRRGEVYLFGGLLVLLVLVCVGSLGFAAMHWLIPAAAPVNTPTVLATAPAVVIATNTLPPPPQMATVTPPPPTATFTPTQGPCTHIVKAGDDLISIAWACGHRSLDVLPMILATNDLPSADALQVGQEIIVPWPTPTIDPNAAAQSDSAESVSSDKGAADASLVSGAATAFQIIPGLELASAPTQGPPTIPSTPTLLPGVMWHDVRHDENAASIAYQYNTTLETLSQLNPEITFSQCDFGKVTGGDACSVIIYEGQQMRVPAPTPIPTLSPTLSGSETPTPSLTPTFNAPSALSPADRALFGRSDLITLRWVASGTLSDGDSYRVRVEDLTAKQTYIDDTSALTYIVPSAWQGQDGKRHDYCWTVSIVSLSDPDHPYFTTEPRLFTWEGR